MTIEEIKAILETAPEEGVEDNRVETVVNELVTRDDKISSLEASVSELTDKVSSLVETNSKLAETIKYAEADEVEEKSEEEEFDFADLENLYGS